MLRASALTIVMLLVGLALACDSEGDGEPDGGGGGGPPPAELVADLDLLPLYPGAEPMDPLYPEGSSTGTELRTGYWASGAIDQVTSFYDQQLPAEWAAEGPWERATYEKAGAKTEQMLRSFAKGDLRLTLTVATTEKDPARGNLNIGVLIQPRDSAPPEKAGPPAFGLDAGDGGFALHWEDYEGEDSYRVAGTATYWPRCREATADAIQEISFDEQLAADTTGFTLPEPSDGEGFFLKELTADLFALGPDGAELDRDGMALTAEPPPCD